MPLCMTSSQLPCRTLIQIHNYTIIKRRYWTRPRLLLSWTWFRFVVLYLTVRVYIGMFRCLDIFICEISRNSGDKTHRINKDIARPIYYLGRRSWSSLKSFTVCLIGSVILDLGRSHVRTNLPWFVDMTSLTQPLYIPQNNTKGTVLSSK